MMVAAWLVWWLIKGTPGFDATFNDSWFVSLLIVIILYCGWAVRTTVAGRR